MGLGVALMGLGSAAGAEKTPSSWPPVGQPVQGSAVMTVHYTREPVVTPQSNPARATTPKVQAPTRTLQQVQAVQEIPPRANGAPSSRIQQDEETEALIRIDLPGPDRLFRREGEAAIFERIRQESRRPGTASRIIFPEEQPVTTEPFIVRAWPPSVESVEPIYVCHGRLLFEQPNFERQGWDLGVFSPVVSLGTFYYDMFALPMHLWRRPCTHYECSAGKCLPGDPTPLLGYPLDYTLTGVGGSAFTYMGGAFIIP